MNILGLSGAVFHDPSAALFIDGKLVAATEFGERIRKLEHVYLGPSYTTEQCLAACRAHPGQPRSERLTDAPKTAAEPLAAGHPVAWFQGRMEFGLRALGN